MYHKTLDYLVVNFASDYFIWLQNNPSFPMTRKKINKPIFLPFSIDDQEIKNKITQEIIQI
jgi:hypothetical protein